MNDARISVLMVATSYPRSASDPAGGFVASLAEMLVTQGADVRVLAPHDRDVPESEVLGGVRVRRFRYMPESLERVAYGSGIMNNVKHDPRALLGLPGFVLALRRAVRREARDVDVVHSQWAQTAAIAGPAVGKRPHVVTLHGSDVALIANPVIRMALQRGVRHADALIAVSADLAARAQQYLPAGLATDVIASGVSSRLVALPLIAPTGPGATRFLYVGRLIRSKGVYELARAFCSLDGDSTLTLIGPGPARAELEDVFSRAGVSGRVGFLGQKSHDDVIEAMRGADIVVVPSHLEGCGLTAIEAAAVGTPVIVTRTGAMPDVAGCPEAIVEPGDEAGLARAMRVLSADKGMRDACGRESRLRVSGEFTFEHVASRTLDVYRRVLGRAS